tara:strand:+ start:55 stop:681 length:627 start_codon:yes stop_codon:yes gene_type:complete
MYFLIILIFIIYIKYNNEYKLGNIYLEIIYKIGIIIIIVILLLYIKNEGKLLGGLSLINKDILKKFLILMKKIKRKIIENNNELDNLEIELKLINKIVYNDSIKKILLRKKILINEKKKLIVLLRKILKKYNNILCIYTLNNKEGLLGGELEVFDEDFVKEELKKLREKEEKILRGSVSEMGKSSSLSNESSGIRRLGSFDIEIERVF